MALSGSDFGFSNASNKAVALPKYINVDVFGTQNSCLSLVGSQGKVQDARRSCNCLRVCCVCSPRQRRVGGRWAGRSSCSRRCHTSSVLGQPSSGSAWRASPAEGVTAETGDRGVTALSVAEDRDWWTERTSDRSAGWMQVIDRVYTYGRWQVHMIGCSRGAECMNCTCCVAEVSNPRE